MLKNILKLNEAKPLNKIEQLAISGGNSCIATCYYSCAAVSSTRVELGDCFDECQQNCWSSIN